LRDRQPDRPQQIARDPRRLRAQTGQDIVYERCLAPLDGFADTVRA
jgi:hypothetical protein